MKAVINEMDFFHVKMLTVFSSLFFMDVHIIKGYNTCPLPLNCCKSYRSNQSNEIICTECLPGYYGPGCKYACRYPNFGKECQSECVCDEENCNHITGCEQRTCLEDYVGTGCNSAYQFSMYYADYVIDDTTAEDPSDVTQNSTKHDQYLNKSTDKGISFPGHDVILNCSSVRRYITRQFQKSAILIILCFLTSAFFVIIIMYFRLNKRPTTCLWR